MSSKQHAFFDSGGEEEADIETSREATTVSPRRTNPPPLPALPPPPVAAVPKEAPRTEEQQEDVNENSNSSPVLLALPDKRRRLSGSGQRRGSASLLTRWENSASPTAARQRRNSAQLSPVDPSSPFDSPSAFGGRRGSGSRSPIVIEPRSDTEDKGFSEPNSALLLGRSSDGTTALSGSFSAEKFAGSFRKKKVVSNLALKWEQANAQKKHRMDAQRAAGALEQIKTDEKVLRKEKSNVPSVMRSFKKSENRQNSDKLEVLAKVNSSILGGASGSKQSTNSNTFARKTSKSKGSKEGRVKSVSLLVSDQTSRRSSKRSSASSSAVPEITVHGDTDQQEKLLTAGAKKLRKAERMKRKAQKAKFHGDLDFSANESAAHGSDEENSGESDLSSTGLEARIRAQQKTTAIPPRKSPRHSTVGGVIADHVWTASVNQAGIKKRVEWGAQSARVAGTASAALAKSTNAATEKKATPQTTPRQRYFGVGDDDEEEVEHLAIFPKTTRELMDVPTEQLSGFSRRERDFRKSRQGKMVDEHLEEDDRIKLTSGQLAISLNMHRSQGMLKDILDHHASSARGNPLLFSELPAHGASTRVAEKSGFGLGGGGVAARSMIIGHDHQARSFLQQTSPGTQKQSGNSSQRGRSLSAAATMGQSARVGGSRSISLPPAQKKRSFSSSVNNNNDNQEMIASLNQQSRRRSSLAPAMDTSRTAQLPGAQNSQNKEDNFLSLADLMAQEEDEEKTIVTDKIVDEATKEVREVKRRSSVLSIASRESGQATPAANPLLPLSRQGTPETKPFILPLPAEGGAVVSDQGHEADDDDDQDEEEDNTDDEMGEFMMTIVEPENDQHTLKLPGVDSSTRLKPSSLSTHKRSRSGVTFLNLSNQEEKDRKASSTKLQLRTNSSAMYDSDVGGAAPRRGTSQRSSMNSMIMAASASQRQRSKSFSKDEKRKILRQRKKRHRKMLLLQVEEPDEKDDVAAAVMEASRHTSALVAADPSQLLKSSCLLTGPAAKIVKRNSTVFMSEEARRLTGAPESSSSNDDETGEEEDASFRQDFDPGLGLNAPLVKSPTDEASSRRTSQQQTTILSQDFLSTVSSPQTTTGFGSEVILPEVLASPPADGGTGMRLFESRRLSSVGQLPSSTSNHDDGGSPQLSDVLPTVLPNIAVEDVADEETASGVAASSASPIHATPRRLSVSSTSVMGMKAAGSSAPPMVIVTPSEHATTPPVLSPRPFALDNDVERRVSQGVLSIQSATSAASSSHHGSNSGRGHYLSSARASTASTQNNNNNNTSAICSSSKDGSDNSNDVEKKSRMPANATSGSAFRNEVRYLMLRMLVPDCVATDAQRDAYEQRELEKERELNKVIRRLSQQQQEAGGGALDEGTAGGSGGSNISPDAGGVTSSEGGNSSIVSNQRQPTPTSRPRRVSTSSAASNGVGKVFDKSPLFLIENAVDDAKNQGKVTGALAAEPQQASSKASKDKREEEVLLKAELSSPKVALSARHGPASTKHAGLSSTTPQAHILSPPPSNSPRAVANGNKPQPKSLTTGVAVMLARAGDASTNLNSGKKGIQVTSADHEQRRKKTSLALAGLVLKAGGTSVGGSGRDGYSPSAEQALLKKLSKSHMHLLVSAPKVDWVVKRVSAITRSRADERRRQQKKNRTVHQLAVQAAIKKAKAEGRAPPQHDDHLEEIQVMKDRQEGLLETLGAWHQRISYRLVETEAEHEERQTRAEGGVSIVMGNSISNRREETGESTSQQKKRSDPVEAKGGGCTGSGGCAVM